MNEAPAPENVGSQGQTEAQVRATVREDVHNLKRCAVPVGITVVVLSIAFNIFVWRQNTNLSTALTNRNRQLASMAEQQQRLGPALHEIVSYAQRQPEVKAILLKYGIQAQPQPQQQPPGGGGVFSVPQGR